MRFGFALLLTAIPLLWGCAGPSGSLTEDQEAALTAEVMETLDSLTEAMNANDPDAVFAFYRQDESFYYLGCTSVLYGWNTFSSRVGPYYSHTDETFQRQILSIQILAPTVAVAALRGSSTDVEALFWTQVLQKNDQGRWLVTHEHESWAGCPSPGGPHMGTTGEPGQEMVDPDAGSQGL